HESFSLHDDEKEARGERYWLIISLILINLSLMATYLMVLYEGTPDNIFHLVRDVLGVGLVYLGSTSLFRIYPPAVRLSKNNYAPTELSNEDKNIIECIHKLLELDKVYQELQFSRAHLARELNISEARVSKLVNVHFGKSLPQLINDYRVRDSLQLLEQTGASVTVVAQEVGFNSLPTFNRVFKDVMGVSPSDYRQRKKSA
ncbi:MAG: helix-turn-helix transcriptional regulator, partial [Pseudomonadota bacterium]